jgi:hypothetical protein
MGIFVMMVAALHEQYRKHLATLLGCLISPPRNVHLPATRMSAPRHYRAKVGNQHQVQSLGMMTLIGSVGQTL